MIAPDDKDWTWVLDKPCPECGFDAGELHREDIGTRLLQAARDLRVHATDATASVRTDPDRWSTLEYLCHVRDVCRVFDTRLVDMLLTDDPAFANWDQDATAEAESYGSQDPVRIGEQLWDDAQGLAGRFNGVTDDQWDRTGNRSDGAHFTVVSLGQYLVHDLVHHVWDVTGQQQD